MLSSIHKANMILFEMAKRIDEENYSRYLEEKKERKKLRKTLKKLNRHIKNNK